MKSIESLDNKRVALVTGGNRGIGREISRQLALKGYHVLIGCRDAEKGRKTVEELSNDGLNIDLQVVDVNQVESIDQMIQRVKKEHGRLDVLVNNAGIILDRGVSILDVEETIIKETFETNFFGVLRMIHTVVPLMKHMGYGRIVNLSSGLGAFEMMSGQGPYKDHPLVSQIKGSSSAYRISKTMLNALTSLVAHEVAGTNIKVNAVCPGSVQTDMGGSDAPSTVEEGADTAVWLATLSENGPNGGYFRDRQPIAW
ncbi:SDR family oxidoreductase [Bacillus horti]|uniref:NAD(P)-dependent dehydrogenase (Short-subunit alcohol dehydrogenase family) n=1 Tax=Caldalkalibacillus horti TaxID=77523 RepID=A0ABT9W2B0_9BACI|nr:SDR family oxidoreductase [Bacillus horti]MDQ0166980.1 NAD(P)-dependent dehydrogenase (short-subunit alcohol dehydrogenase family) [Bacillus horti]